MPQFLSSLVCVLTDLMPNFLIGIVTGIVLATVGFNGIANLGNKAIDGIQSFATENQQ